MLQAADCGADEVNSVLRGWGGGGGGVCVVRLSNQAESAHAHTVLRGLIRQSD